MLRLTNEVERLIEMLSKNSEVITYEGYSRAKGDSAISKDEWDSLIVIVGTKQMLPTGTMKVVINNIKKIIEEEKRSKEG